MESWLAVSVHRRVPFWKGPAQFPAGWRGYEGGGGVNVFLHGNLAEYIVELPNRIGKKKVEELYRDRDLPLKLSIVEIKELIVVYKNKIKKLKG